LKIYCMAKKTDKFKTFGYYAIKKVNTINDRAIAFLYFQAITENRGASIDELINFFDILGLGKPNTTKLRYFLSGDKRTKKVASDTWRLKSDKVEEVGLELGIAECVEQDKKQKSQIQHKKWGSEFVDPERIKQLKHLGNSGWDFSRLIKMCDELNLNFSQKNYIATIALVRSVLNHVPPIFQSKTFSEVVNNYKCEKSTKESFEHLENSSRKIADFYLHVPIRKRESLPTRTQVNFSQELDVIIGEIVRILK